MTDRTSVARTLDLNADLGEGVATSALDATQVDDALLAVVTSANVACGGHAGDASSMARVCAVAVERGVAIGAQVSYVDRAGFGRRRLDVDARTLQAQLLEQLGELRTHARAAGGRVAYVKPHGALYNTAADDPEVADAVVSTVLADADSHRQLPVLTLPGSALALRARAAGIEVVAEAFADRAYTRAGRLVPRSHDGAVITDPDAVVARVLRLESDGLLESADGHDIAIDARSVCLHSDTDGAVDLARSVRQALWAAGVVLVPFSGVR
ncbi:LamB/YcsF family protein [Longivirga aurantiaca]|uniref:LamB/YcsF family protein n=1 Tax=Longivirga aurantiaca TaxID=1837743 RepID=A0ABW1T539_9ACTN